MAILCWGAGQSPDPITPNGQILACLLLPHSPPCPREPHVAGNVIAMPQNGAPEAA